MNLGESGHILIHSSGNRLNSYKVLEYSAGHDSFYSVMTVDLTQSRDKVSYTFAITDSTSEFKPTQLPALCGTGNEYWPKRDDVCDWDYILDRSFIVWVTGNTMRSL